MCAGAGVSRRWVFEEWRAEVSDGVVAFRVGRERRRLEHPDSVSLVGAGRWPCNGAAPGRSSAEWAGAGGGHELVEQAEEDWLPVVEGQQSHDELPAGLHHLGRQPEEAIHERAELHA